MPKGHIQVAVVGATGYAGAEVVRLLSQHPCACITAVTSSRNPGKLLREECPWLASELRLTSFDADSLQADFVFLAQEAGFAMEQAPALLKRSRVIDLSADFRLSNPDEYAKYYGRMPSAGGPKAAYGLPELVDRQSIAVAPLVANPGCYPTASLLALMPLVKHDLISGVPVIDAKSGASGAGRARRGADDLFSEVSGGFKVYAPVGHRHIPEIEQLAGTKVRFTPHLLPFARGLETTLHVPLKPDPAIDIFELYSDFYSGESFVAIQREPPSTKQVVGSNMCVIAPKFDEHTGYAVVSSVIDNLVKGAAGQAIQNMNLMAGLLEHTGLPLGGVWP